MPGFDDVPRTEVTDLLNKCWMTHDGMWFFHCLQEFGIETTNRLNKSAIKSLAAMEVQRLRRMLGFDTDIDNFPDFERFFRGAAHYMIPDFMNGSFDFPRKNTMTWVFKENQCFAYKGIKRLGVIEDYECGVLYRIKCWIEALGMACDVTPEIGPCHMHYTGTCTGNIQLYL
jgi:hypothetical protein